MRVSELMSRNVVTIDTAASCHDAVALMARARVRHLPVVDAGALVGVVTDRDLRHHLFRPGVFEAIGTVPIKNRTTPGVTRSPTPTYREAWRFGLKEVTIYRYGSRARQVLTLGVDEDSTGREFFAKCGSGRLSALSEGARARPSRGDGFRPSCHAC